MLKHGHNIQVIIFNENMGSNFHCNTVALGWGLLTDILIATRKKEYGGKCHKICFTTKDHPLQTVAHY
jgi:hypothetical protein